MNTKAIKDERIDHDYLQKDIAKILKISTQYYSRYEKGQIDMPIRHLITLAKLYNVSIDYLVGLKGKEKLYPKENKDVQFANEVKKSYRKFYEENKNVEKI